jgi:hypothetical protein
MKRTLSNLGSHKSASADSAGHAEVTPPRSPEATTPRTPGSNNLQTPKSPYDRRGTFDNLKGMLLRRSGSPRRADPETKQPNPGDAAANTTSSARPANPERSSAARNGLRPLTAEEQGAIELLRSPEFRARDITVTGAVADAKLGTPAKLYAILDNKSAALAFQKFCAGEYNTDMLEFFTASRSLLARTDDRVIPEMIADFRAYQMGNETFLVTSIATVNLDGEGQMTGQVVVNRLEALTVAEVDDQAEAYEPFKQALEQLKGKAEKFLMNDVLKRFLKDIYRMEPPAAGSSSSSSSTGASSSS